MSSGFVIMDDETLRRIAHIIGPQSAAAKALEEVERQRADGIDAVVGTAGRMFTVCSRRFAEMRAASGTLTEGGDVKQAPGESLSGATLEEGDAHA